MASLSFGLAATLGQDLVCTGCGKDPYHSGTGCLCPPGAGNWVPRDEKAAEPKAGKDSRGAADDAEIICSCGQVRRRAAKAPDRVLPCRHCGDSARDAADLIR
mmetsp:Transcript_5939/g.10772  ORF Transcript_5939/g.10772 Transcript_5939/m.10772 type:complete len:103 (+) Transcript_5939:65-373(+)